MVNSKQPPVYLLAGEEHFLKEKQLFKITSSFLEEKTRAFNFHVFYAGASTAGDVLECACNAPFLAKKRVVVVHQVEEFGLKDREAILSYVKSPYPHTVLVLETAETNLKSAFLKELQQGAELVFCRSIQGLALLRWIEDAAGERKKKIEHSAKDLLVRNLGNNLKLISNALENLFLYIGKRTTITSVDVERLVGRDLTASAFELFDAIKACKSDSTLRILDTLLKEGIDAAQILGALSYKVISEKPRVVTSKFIRSIKAIEVTDSDIKRGRCTPRIALELLMTKLLKAHA
jgi:DNA polymerase-3 subunit delta